MLVFSARFLDLLIFECHLLWVVTYSGICLCHLLVSFHIQQLPVSDAVRLIHDNEFPSPIFWEKLEAGTALEIVNYIKYNSIMVF